MALHSETKFAHLAPFLTEKGQWLQDARIAYRTWGTLNAEASNAIVIFHALSGSADADEWFGPLFGANSIANPEKHFIVCCNVPGSCYGSSSASDKDQDGVVLGSRFPFITIRDMVNLQRQVFDLLGIKQIELAIGGSLGGMQTLELCLLDDRVCQAVVMAAGARHSAWAISWNHLQRQAIQNDRDWKSGNYDPEKPPVQGLSLARQIAMLSYRSFADYELKFGRKLQDEATIPESLFPYFEAESYLSYQGKKMVQRFDARAYWTLTHALDSHDICRDRSGDLAEILARITIPILVIAIDSDVLYPPEEQQEIADALPQGQLHVINSPHGHDAFLINFDQIIEAYQQFTPSAGLLIR